MFAFINDRFLPVAEAVIHVSDLSVQRGFGVFDFLKVTGQHPFFLDDYLDRFHRSASRMSMTCPLRREELRDVIFDLIARNNLHESGVKMILTGGYSPDGYEPTAPNLIVTQHPLVLPDADIIRKGVKVITHEYVRDIPEAKTINYTMGISLLHKVREASAYDVLYHANGVVSEFPRSNFFIVKADGTLVTAARNVLAGVTRKNVLDVAKRFYPVLETDISLNDVRKASEAFITSTTKRIVPIVRVDDFPIGQGEPGPVSAHLLNMLRSSEQEDMARTSK